MNFDTRELKHYLECNGKTIEDFKIWVKGVKNG